MKYLLWVPACLKVKWDSQAVTVPFSRSQFNLFPSLGVSASWIALHCVELFLFWCLDIQNVGIAPQGVFWSLKVRFTHERQVPLSWCVAFGGGGMTAKSASLSQLSFPTQSASNVHWHIHLRFPGPSILLVKTWTILTEQGVGKKESEVSAQAYGFSKGFWQGSTPKVIKEMKFL